MLKRKTKPAIPPVRKTKKEKPKFPNLREAKLLAKKYGYTLKDDYLIYDEYGIILGSLCLIETKKGSVSIAVTLKRAEHKKHRNIAIKKI